MSAEKNPIDTEDTFEGEETLGAELRENYSSPESDTSDIYPDAVVNIVPESASVFQLKRKLDKTPPLIKLDPDIQRYAVWSPKQKSELIESILMGIPLPLIYVKEDDKGVYIIVDGRQRLTTLFQFMSHEFPLQNLTVLKDLNGAYFSEMTKNGTKFDKYLTQPQQSKIEDCPLTLHVIKPPTQDRVTFDLFDRVNRGGTRLNNQEMRNAIYQGSATKLLNKIVAFSSFKMATEHSIKPDRMKDKYLVLRMIGFYLWRKKQLLSVKEKGLPPVEYRSDLEDFLGKTMLFLNDQAGSEFGAQFPERFDKTMKACRAILGVGCFRLPKKGDGPRRPISMALFETVTYLIIELIDQPQEKYDFIKKGFTKLLSNEKFILSTTYTVDSNISVYKRFEITESIIEEIRNA
ncbi:MAG: hypothetical protein A2277_17100 [Desulfobacterales bacterium RIFOXYA12_FULL_46_15]|nr:MAG: hypothetical protein A2277_17100 [Desulfobacterales bacterium RIFOXYA12_FULL_46_15]